MCVYIYIYNIYICVCVCVCVCVGGPGSSVGIATDYGLDGPGSNPGGDEIFPPVQTGPGAHPASCKVCTGSFPGIKCGRGVLLTTHPLLVRGHGRVELYLYPPSGSHRACNGITLPFICMHPELQKAAMHSEATTQHAIYERHKNIPYQLRAVSCGQ